jgi:preprotein translocase subunit SecD
VARTSARSRFLLRALAVGIALVVLVAVAGALWAWATTATYVVVYRLDLPAGRPVADALPQTVRILSDRLKAVRADLELGRSSVRALPPDRVEFTVRSRQGPDYALAWLAMQGRAEFRLLHPDEHVLDLAGPLPDDYEVKTYTERRYILTRLNELKPVGHSFAVLREPAMVVDGFQHVTFQTVGHQRAVVLTFEFKPDDGRKFAEVTALHAGRRMAMLIDGEMFFPPGPIEGAITGGRVQMQGFFMKRPMRRLARLLECGSLPGRLVRVGEAAESAPAAGASPSEEVVER